jgi:cytochrome c peroxidase
MVAMPQSSGNPRNVLRNSIAALTLGAALFLLVGTAVAHHDNSYDDIIKAFDVFHDDHGEFATINKAGNTNTKHNAFFQDLGTNGRRCVTCHQQADAWTVTPEHVQDRFERTDGTDPIFRPVDGANCNNLDFSSKRARKKNYSLLLNKGLIRVELPVPGGAEFTVRDTDNPYGCTDTQNISVYRRILPTTNISFLSTVMWDGRETFKDASGKFLPVRDDLMHQAIDATLIHAQGAKAPTDAQLNEIVDFETQLFTAQIHDRHAGDLNDDGANGGPKYLTKQIYFNGINDPLGGNPQGDPFTSTIFTLYDKWSNIKDRNYDEHTDARRSIARGENLFNTLNIPITGVGGLNDALNAPVINGFCGTCHDTPNVGHHSVPLPINIGIADPDQRTPDLPLFTVQNNTTGEIKQVTDIGRALITGKWADVGKFKGPILRGLAGRAPYFHNGMAADLDAVIDFYNTRFKLNLSKRDHNDLVAFLKTL